jgi:hypothetical protein
MKIERTNITIVAYLVKGRQVVGGTVKKLYGLQS